MFARDEVARVGARPRRVARYVLAALIALAAGAGAAIALSSPGSLDPSFGTNGTTVLEHETDTFPVAGALASANKSVIVSTPDAGKIVVQRRLADGRPDLSFDGTGEAVIETPGFPGAFALAVQPNGDILVAGRDQVAGNDDAAVWRLKSEGGSSAPNGDLDTSFGSGGLVNLHTGEENFANALALQSDGRIIVAGDLHSGAEEDKVAVWRLTSDGGLDPSFNTTGEQTLSDGKADIANAAAIAPDGKIVVAGESFDASNAPDAGVWRLDADGSVDTTFDGDGQANIDSGGEDFASSVVVQPDEKILVGARAHKSGGAEQGIVWRLLANGGKTNTTNDALDPTFGHKGTALISGDGDAEIDALALQPDGKVLAAGSTDAGSAPFLAALWRLDPEGGSAEPNSQLDATFGKDGMTTVNTGGEGDDANSLALGDDRRALVVGATFTGGILAFRALGDPFTLNVARAGSGAGTVSSSPAGIGCGGACAAQFDDGSTVTLSASAATGSQFAGWSGGGCSGTSTCTVAMSSDQTVTAVFNLVPPATGTVSKPLVLATPGLHFAKLKRGAKHFSVTVGGLPAGTHVSGALLAGAKVLARAHATVGAHGSAVLTFKFSKQSRRRLHEHSLAKVKLTVTAVFGALHAPSVTKTLKLAR